MVIRCSESSLDCILFKFLAVAKIVLATANDFGFPLFFKFSNFFFRGKLAAVNIHWPYCFALTHYFVCSALVRYCLLCTCVLVCSADMLFPDLVGSATICTAMLHLHYSALAHCSVLTMSCLLCTLLFWASKILESCCSEYVFRCSEFLLPVIFYIISLQRDSDSLQRLLSSLLLPNLAAKCVRATVNGHGILLAFF